jgi:hypothetical protein
MAPHYNLFGLLAGIELGIGLLALLDSNHRWWFSAMRMPGVTERKPLLHRKLNNGL